VCVCVCVYIYIYIYKHKSLALSGEHEKIHPETEFFSRENTFGIREQNMSRVYIRYISLWNQTDSKSYIIVIGYSRGTKLCITRYIEQS